MRRLNPSRDSARFVENLPPKQFRQVWLKVISLLTEPFPHDAAALTGSPFHRVDVGEYRIIYQADRDQVDLILIGKRNDDSVYKQLERKL